MPTALDLLQRSEEGEEIQANLESHTSEAAGTNFLWGKVYSQKFGRNRLYGFLRLKMQVVSSCK